MPSTRSHVRPYGERLRGDWAPRAVIGISTAVGTIHGISKAKANTHEPFMLLICAFDGMVYGWCSHQCDCYKVQQSTQSIQPCQHARRSGPTAYSTYDDQSISSGADDRTKCDKKEERRKTS